MFKDIEGYEGRYQIDEHGNIRTQWARYRRHREQLDEDGWRSVATHVMNTGYPAVCLIHPTTGDPRSRTIHRLVAETHLPNPEGLTCVLHRDGDKMNSSLDNLYWGDYSQNTYDMVKHGTHNNASKVYCKRGHLLEGDNVRWSTHRGTTRRQCLPCKRITDRTYGAKWRERKRQEKSD